MKTLEEAAAVVLQQDAGDYFERSRELGAELMNNPAVLRALVSIACSDRPPDVQLALAFTTRIYGWSRDGEAMSDRHTVDTGVYC